MPVAGLAWLTGSKVFASCQKSIGVRPSTAYVTKTFIDELAAKRLGHPSANILSSPWVLDLFMQSRSKDEGRVSLCRREAKSTRIRPNTV